MKRYTFTTRNHTHSFLQAQKRPKRQNRWQTRHYRYARALRYFTEAIAGDRFTVVSMVPKGTSPETYDPTPQQLVDLARSKAYFRIGYIGFEQTWTDKLTDNAPHLQFFDMSQGVDLIYDNTHSHRHVEDGKEHHHATGVEPHIWNSATNAQIIAGNILSALCSIDKSNESAYLERYNALCRQIEHTDSLIRQTLTAPGADHAFMIYHPALSYFARDYGLHQIPIEAGGKEPSPAHLKALIDTCKSEKYMSSSYSRSSTAATPKSSPNKPEPGLSISTPCPTIGKRKC